MPNVRKHGKKRLGAFMDATEQEVIRTAAAKVGLNVSDFIRYLTYKHAFQDGLVTAQDFLREVEAIEETRVFANSGPLPAAIRDEVADLVKRKPKDQSKSKNEGSSK